MFFGEFTEEHMEEVMFKLRPKKKQQQSRCEPSEGRKGGRHSKGPEISMGRVHSTN